MTSGDSKTSNVRSVMIVAGEPSGDAHASALVKALRAQTADGQLEFFGATGPLMRTAGVEAVVNSDELAILGLLEIGRALPKFWRAFQDLKQAAAERKPAAAILVDWPDFNFRLARALHSRGIKIIYYISPQLWAWRSHRVRNVKRDVDLMLAILPFEADWYAKRGVHHVEFIGHPLAGEVHARYGRQEFCRGQNLASERPIISFLPGSRSKELQRILPPMLDAATTIRRQRSDIQFVVAVAPNLAVSVAHRLIAESAPHLQNAIRVTQKETWETLAASDAAAVASGTATLEAALLGTPMVIVYQESRINWHTLGQLINTEHYGLVNLIANQRLVTELIQNDFNGPRLAGELMSLLEKERNKAVRHQLSEVSAKLGEVGASQRAATRILAALNEDAAKR